MRASDVQELDELDKYELALLEKKRELEACQNSKGVDSCLKCSETIGCELRNSFVDAAYRSMHKDKGGGFEF